MTENRPDAPDRECWNEALERLSLDDAREMESARLRQQVDYTWVSSPFYREKWARAGVDPRRVTSLDELPLLPFTEKAELMASQEARPPFGANQCVALDRLIRMQATGGTTGRPLRMALTRVDVDVYNELGARSAWAAGLRPGDVLLECMNYSLYAGGVNDHMTFETIGACVAPVGIGQSRRLLEILRDMRLPTTLYSTPSYALHLAEVARAQGLHPPDLGIKRGLLSGDAGLAIAGYREHIEQVWGMEARDVYGLGELGAPGAECAERDGLHWLGQGLLAAELIDPATEQPIDFADGASGELVLSTLEREAFPLLRFRTHDHVEVRTSPCRCGRGGFRFRVLGRSDDMFIVKGINVYPLAIQDVVGSFRPELSGDVQILLDEPPPLVRDPRLRVEAGPHVPVEQLPAIAERLTRRIRDVLMFTPDVEILAPGRLPRTERKAKRLYRTYLGEDPAAGA